MDSFLARANIARYRLMLDGPLPSADRAMVERLLAEEAAKITKSKPGPAAPK